MAPLSQRDEQSRRGLLWSNFMLTPVRSSFNREKRVAAARTNRPEHAISANIVQHAVPLKKHNLRDASVERASNHSTDDESPDESAGEAADEARQGEASVSVLAERMITQSPPVPWYHRYKPLAEYCTLPRLAH